MNAGIAVGDDVKYEPDTSGQPKGGLKGGKARAQLLQFAAHLPPLLCKAPRFCALLFGELAMLDFRLCESRKAVLGPRTGTRASMELTAPHRETGGALTGRTPARPGLAPNTLPVWAV